MATDIDFDELDKAVNSLMGKVADVPEKPGEDVPKQETLTINNTLKPGEKPVYDKIGEVAKEIANEALTTDGERIVLENLDNLQAPVLPDLSQPDVVTAPPVSSPSPVSVNQPTSKSVVAPVPRPAGGRFMDVVHPSSDMRTPTQTPPVSQPITATVEAPKAAETPIVAPISAEAPLTPFLPDAKVEKRPLGAVPSPFDGDAVQSPAPELRPDPVSAEVVAPTVVPPEEPKSTLEVANQPQVENEATKSSLGGEGLLQAIESGDTEKINASLGEDASGASEGAIYDVNQYPQPLNHPGKQKSGIGVVIIIVLIIVLAAALGGAAYFILGLGV